VFLFVRPFRGGPKRRLLALELLDLATQSLDLEARDGRERAFAHAALQEAFLHHSREVAGGCAPRSSHP